MTDRKVVGVLGGMGPDATVDFMSKVIALTPADKDQDHIHMLVDHNPTVPNRQEAILGEGEDPGPAMAAMAKRLEDAGADFLVMPCNTAYVFEQSIIDAVNIPLISIIDESIAALPTKCARVGLLATDGCLKADVYQKSLRDKRIEAIEPDGDDMQELMGLIHAIKSGDTSAAIADTMRALAEELARKRAARHGGFRRARR